MRRSAHSSISSRDDSSDDWRLNSSLSSSLSSSASSSDDSDDDSASDLSSHICATLAPVIGPTDVKSSPNKSRAARYVDPQDTSTPFSNLWRTPTSSSPGASTSPPTSPVEQIHSHRASIEAGFMDTHTVAAAAAAAVQHRPKASTQTSHLLVRLTPEVVRLVCSYLPTVTILQHVVPICKSIYAALGGGARSNPQIAKHFWEQRWSASYVNVLPPRIYSLNRLVARDPSGSPVIAHLQRFVVNGSSTSFPSENVAIDQHQRVQHYLDVRGGSLVMSSEPSRLKVIRITDSEPHPPDTESLAMLADQVASALQWCYLNGYATPQQKVLEESLNFRTSVGMGTATAERPGFGVILPMYHHVGVERGHALKLEEDCRQMGYSSPPTVADQSDSSITRPVRPYYRLQDLQMYWWMLERTLLSDVKHYAWFEETKLATCATILSPIGGHAAEVRFYAGSLQGSIPRFYVKCVMAPATSLPSEDIVDNFQDAAELFCGGFGRVEVDVAPRVRRAHFEELRDALGLHPTFPLTLLWNVVCGATGCVATIAKQNHSFLMSFERQTFADVAAAVLKDETT